MPHVNKKPLAKKGNLVQSRKTKPRMNYEWIEKTSNKKSDPNMEKTQPHVNKKIASEKANFCSNTIVSLYFKFE